MAAVFSLKDFDKSEKDLIRKYLVFKPEDKSLPDFLQRKYHIPPKKEIYFYKISKIGEDEYIWLPYAFASSLVKRPLNSHLDHQLSTIKFTGKLFDNQESVTKEAYQQLLDKSTTTINLAAGFGKTVIGAYLACKLKLKVVIICFTKILCPQWEKAFFENTTATVWKVPSNLNPEKIPGYSYKDNKLILDKIPDVIICMDQRVHKLPNIYRKLFGCLILDEAHTLCTPGKVTSLLSWEPRYIIAETATINRADGLYNMMVSLCGPHLVQREQKKEFDVLKINTGVIPDTSKKNGYRPGPDYNAMMNSLLENKIRNDIIISLVEENKDFKILILSRYKNILINLKDILSSKGESVDIFAGNKKTYSDSRVLLGTIKKIGTGFDEKNACADFNGIRINMLIMITSIKDLALLEQCVGRAFRADCPTIVDLVDKHGIFTRHWNIRRKWFTERGANITEISMVPEDKPVKLEDRVISEEELGDMLQYVKDQ